MKFVIYFSLILGIIVTLRVLIAWLERFYFRPQGREVAGLTRRGLAFFFDMMFFHVSAMLYLLYKFVSDSAFKADFKYWINEMPKQWFIEKLGTIELILLGAYLIYAMVLESTAMRGTMGKLVLGVKVEYGNAGFFSGVIRNLAKAISFLLLPVSIVIGKSNTGRRMLHDFLGTTWVRQTEA